MAIAHIESVVVVGLDGVGVDVEVDIGLGLPTFTIVGLPDKSVEEAKERVRSAFKNANIPFPQHRLTVNLAPADIKKAGTWYDLPIAVGIALAMGQVEQQAVKDSLFIGELSLGGAVRAVSGVLPAVLHGATHHKAAVFIPQENSAEGQLVHGVVVHPVENLAQVLLHLRGEKLLPALEHLDLQKRVPHAPEVDIGVIKGQAHAKRALEIAAAGAHNILLSGPPGSGKTLLAKAFVGLLPALTTDEILELTKIYSVAGLLSADLPLIHSRPFRSPHHTASVISLIGGGQWPKPGEISLAHRGVLFMDEFPEFPRSLLEALRQPLEDGSVTISRVSRSLSYPAQFTLLATQNPCPCGYLYDKTHQCKCTPTEINRYQKKLSGPLLDRIDLHVPVPAVEADEFTGKADGESTHTIRSRIEAARKRQEARFKEVDVHVNSEMHIKHIEMFCALDQTSSDMIKDAMRHLGLSGRSVHRIVKVARTIADLAEHEAIEAADIAEALQFRYTT